MTELAADRDAVLAALDRLTAWSEMARSPQLTRFLSYIVHKRLDGDTQSVKAYSIAVDVFGRPADFDPQSDPIVRVQARRLRALLEQYYRGPGAEDALQIHLPVGRYVPDFIVIPAIPAPADESPRRSMSAGGGPHLDPPLDDAGPTNRPRGHVTVSWYVLLVIAIGIAALAYSLSTWGPRQVPRAVAIEALQPPELRVMDFQNLTGIPGVTTALSALAIEIVTDFTPFIVVDVIYDGRGDVVVSGEVQEDFLLSGVVRQETPESELTVNAILTDQASNSVVWNQSIRVPLSNLLAQGGGVETISRRLVGALGTLRGPLHARARDLLNSSSEIGRENFYVCAVLFNMYRASQTAGAAERVRSCIAALPEGERTHPSLLAMQASMVAEASEPVRITTASQMARFGQANELITQALQAAPTSSFVWEQRARLHEDLSAHDHAEGAYGTALQLNPSSVDALAAHARHLALIGQLDEAIPMAQRAIDSVPLASVPAWYQCVPALAALRNNDFVRALRLSDLCARVDSEIGAPVAIVAAQGLGDPEAIARQLPRVLEIATFRGFGIMTQLRRRITDTVLLERIREALVTAGIPPMSLVSGY